MENDKKVSLKSYRPIEFTNLEEIYFDSYELIKQMNHKFRREIYLLMCDMQDYLEAHGTKRDAPNVTKCEVTDESV